MKKFIIALVILLIPYYLFANTYTYVSASNFIYRADYISTTYNLTSKETADVSRSGLSLEMGYKSNISNNIMIGVTYGYNIVTFNNNLSIINFPFYYDTYFTLEKAYLSTSIGGTITFNSNGTSLIPAIKIGIGYDFTICNNFNIGVKSSVEAGIWPYKTGISEYATFVKAKLLEIYFLFKN